MSPNKRTKTMSENAIGNKSTEFIRKNVGIGNLLGLKNVNIYSFSLNKDTGAVTIEACSRRHSAKCPACGASSRSVHSSYVRKVADLPISGRRVISERHEAVGWYRRRTRRAEDLILHTALETSARKAEHMMSLQGLEVSDTTCLRLVMREELPDYPDVRRIGIDDWSWRRGMRYGTPKLTNVDSITIAKHKNGKYYLRVVFNNFGHSEIFFLSKEETRVYLLAADAMERERLKQ